jgi:hypothetical protein
MGLCWRAGERWAVGDSGRDALVVMVQATDFLDLDDESSVDCMGLTPVRAVHRERLVRSPPVVVAEVVSEDPLQVPLADHDHVIEAFAPY